MFFRSAEGGSLRQISVRQRPRSSSASRVTTAAGSGGWASFVSASRLEAWNCFHDLLIKISSDAVAALESEPPWKDKAADRAALLLNSGHH